VLIIVRKENRKEVKRMSDESKANNWMYQTITQGITGCCCWNNADVFARDGLLNELERYSATNIRLKDVTRTDFKIVYKSGEYTPK